MTTAESSDYHEHSAVFLDIENRGVFSDENIADRIDRFRAEHHSRMYYDIDRPGRDLALGMYDLAEEVHSYIVTFADAQSRCSCDRTHD